MVAVCGLCQFWIETNSLEEVLALQSFDEFRGNVPLHQVKVGRFLWLLPFLVAWARGFWVGLRPLVWVAILFWASMGVPSQAKSAMTTFGFWSGFQVGLDPPHNVKWDCFLPQK